MGLTCKELIRESSWDQYLLGEGRKQDWTKGGIGFNAFMTKPVKSSRTETPSKSFHVGVRDKSFNAGCPGEGEQLSLAEASAEERSQLGAVSQEGSQQLGCLVRQYIHSHNTTKGLTTVPDTLYHSETCHNVAGASHSPIRSQSLPPSSDSVD